MSNLIMPEVEEPFFYNLTREEANNLTRSFNNVGYEGPYGCFNTDREYRIIDSKEGTFLVNRKALETEHYQSLSQSLKDEALEILNSNSL